MWDRWHRVLTTHEDWWPRAPRSGRRQHRFASIWDGWHSVLGCCGLGMKHSDDLGWVVAVTLRI